MTSSPIIPESLLVIEVGEINTRALLFDVVDARYRFIAAGTAPTTLGQPFFNALEGARLAMDNLREVTGRVLINANEQIIIPAAPDGSGVDQMVVVTSAGEPLKILVIGLLEDVSVESAQKLAATTYSQIVATFSLNDRRKLEARLDAILRLRPDVILIAGGTEGGSQQSVLKLIEPVRLAYSLLPIGQRPQILYAGNQALVERLKTIFPDDNALLAAPNIRPTLDVEQLDAAQFYLARMLREVRMQKSAGMAALDTWAGGSLLPASTTFGRLIRFWSLQSKQTGAFGVDVGASAITMAAAYQGTLTMGVFPEHGLLTAPQTILNRSALEAIQFWTYAEIPLERVCEYLHNRPLYPAAVPMDAEELAIEQAIVRYALQQSLQQVLPRFVHTFPNGIAGLLASAQPILAAGSVIVNAPTLGQSLLMLLDGLQPAGVNYLWLDQNHLAVALGAAASVNPTLTVQESASGAFLNLGMVIAPVSNARPGTPILQVKMTDKSGNETKLDVKQGSLETLPLPLGSSARLTLRPLHRADIGMGAGQGGRIEDVVGGVFGIIIDARGRPLQLPAESTRRTELYKKWLWHLGK